MTRVYCDNTFQYREFLGRNRVQEVYDTSLIFSGDWGVENGGTFHRLKELNQIATVMRLSDKDLSVNEFQRVMGLLRVLYPREYDRLQDDLPISNGSAGAEERVARDFRLTIESRHSPSFVAALKAKMGADSEWLGQSATEYIEFLSGSSFPDYSPLRDTVSILPQVREVSVYRESLTPEEKAGFAQNLSGFLAPLLQASPYLGELQADWRNPRLRFVSLEDNRAMRRMGPGFLNFLAFRLCAAEPQQTPQTLVTCQQGYVESKVEVSFRYNSREPAPPMNSDTSAIPFEIQMLTWLMDLRKESTVFRPPPLRLVRFQAQTPESRPQELR
jgi:hypothetical protein